MKSRRGELGDKDTAGKMADAVSYLCRVAAEEGFDTVLCDLLEIRQKLEKIAGEDDEPRRPT
ncbi:hypothetical protein [Bradyrhizobium sp. RDI18]|uniref:hypothetical protein n=1 Tax=Bradyrhizobium sp. RDI18 TaxID=3367400 RepID=UPI003714EFC2